MVTSPFRSPASGERIDWNDIKGRVDLARVVTALLGPAAEATRPPIALALPVPR